MAVYAFPAGNNTQLHSVKLTHCDSVKMFQIHTVT